MADPATIAAVAKAAAAVLSDEHTRKSVGWVIAADLSPLLGEKVGHGAARVEPVPLADGGAAAENSPAVTADSERAWIVEALRRNRFRRGATAHELGLSRKTLYNKIRQHGIE